MIWIMSIGGKTMKNDNLILSRASKQSRFSVLLLLGLAVFSLLIVNRLSHGPLLINKGAKENTNISFSFFPTSGQFSPKNDEPFAFLVYLQNPSPADEIVLATLVLKFDPQLLQVKEIQSNERFANKIKAEFDNARGTITIKQGVGGGEPAIGEKVDFAKIYFMGTGKKQQAQVNIDTDLSSLVSTNAEYLPVSN